MVQSCMVNGSLPSCGYCCGGYEGDSQLMRVEALLVSRFN